MNMDMWCKKCGKDTRHYYANGIVFYCSVCHTPRLTSSTGEDFVKLNLNIPERFGRDLNEFNKAVRGDEDEPI